MTVEEKVNEQDGELHYKCGGHAKWFPEENPLLHWSEFSVDDVTLERKRTYCRRCDNRNKAQYSQAKRQRGERPALERVQDAFAHEEMKLEALARSGRGDGDEAHRVQWHLSYLAGELERLDPVNIQESEVTQ